jgi:hypothetical protein
LLYLLDANVLIDANWDYYSITRIPEFWEWLEYQGRAGLVKTPVEVYEELKEGNDELAKWVKNPDVKEALLLDEEAAVEMVARVTIEGYAPDLTDDEVERIGRDPFLIGYALVDLGNRCIVTTEVSKPKRQRANRQLPDVWRDFGIPTCNTFELVRALDFRTGWNAL